MERKKKKQRQWEKKKKKKKIRRRERIDKISNWNNILIQEIQLLINSNSSDLTCYYSLEKKIQVYRLCWNMNSALTLQILAKKSEYRACWRCSYTTFSLLVCSLPSDDITHNPASPIHSSHPTNIKSLPWHFLRPSLYIEVHWCCTSHNLMPGARLREEPIQAKT